MTIFAYHTPYIASPSNTRRAGTYRISSDDPSPIKISKGWDTVLYFAFRDHMQRPMMTAGRTISAKIYNSENVMVWDGPLVVDALTDGAATLVMGKQATSVFSAGLYSMAIEYTDDMGRTMLAQTQRSLPRFVVEVIDFTTISLNH